MEQLFPRLLQASNDVQEASAAFSEQPARRIGAFVDHSTWEVRRAALSALLSGIAFATGLGITVGIGYGLRFLYVAYLHGGLF